MSSQIEVMFGENGCNGIQSYMKILNRTEWLPLILIKAFRPFLGHSESPETPHSNTIAPEPAADKGTQELDSSEPKIGIFTDLFV